MYYVNTINFLTFCQKPDNTSAFGSVIDEDHYSLSSGTYTLNDNIDISAPVIIPSGANVTVDLNGYTVNRGCGKAADNGQAFIVSTGASLTIIDSAGNGRVTGAYAKNGGAVFVDIDANCSVQGGIFTGNRTDAKGGAFLNYGTLTIENAIVSGNTANDGGAVYNANGGKLNIKGSQLLLIPPSPKVMPVTAIQHIQSCLIRQKYRKSLFSTHQRLLTLPLPNLQTKPLPQ